MKFAALAVLLALPLGACSTGSELSLADADKATEVPVTEPVSMWVPPLPVMPARAKEPGEVPVRPVVRRPRPRPTPVARTVPVRSEAPAPARVPVAAQPIRPMSLDEALLGGVNPRALRSISPAL